MAPRHAVDDFNGLHSQRDDRPPKYELSSFVITRSGLVTGHRLLLALVMVRVLHTADWHLGQTLHGVSRAQEHDAFLAWLLEQLKKHNVDALLIAGDIFDVASPSAEALAQYFGFLARARQLFPKLDMVVVGGNHDAPARLDAARAVLDALKVHVVGGLPRNPDRSWDLERLLIPLYDASDTPKALVLAVPFLRPKDLPKSEQEARQLCGLPPRQVLEANVGGRRDANQRIADGHRYLYAALTEAALTKRPLTSSALIATGHAYIAGGRLSELSERKIQQGNQQALSAAQTFPSVLTYVALGHLHLAQQVSNEPHARYSGSPIPLSMAELDYPHQVLLLDFEGDQLKQVRPALIPRFLDIIRVPPEHAPLADVLTALKALNPAPPPDAEHKRPPLLEVRVKLETAQPRLRHIIEEAVSQAWVQLVRIDVQRADRTETQLPTTQDLTHLDPEEVFNTLHQRFRSSAPPPSLMQAFRELVESQEPQS